MQCRVNYGVFHSGWWEQGLVPASDEPWESFFLFLSWVSFPDFGHVPWSVLHWRVHGGPPQISQGLFCAGHYTPAFSCKLQLPLPQWTLISAASISGDHLALPVSPSSGHGPQIPARQSAVVIAELILLFPISQESPAFTAKRLMSENLFYVLCPISQLFQVGGSMWHLLVIR